MEQTQILVAVAAPATAHIRVLGRATFSCSANLRQFGEEILARDANLRQFGEEILARDGSRLIFHLSGCPLMDSTFLGVMTRFGLAYFKAKRPVQLVGPTEAVLGLFTELGVRRFFEVTQGPLPDLDWHPLYPATEADQPDLRERGRTSLEAHRQLVAANHDNAAKFQTVIKSLESDLERLDQKPPPGRPAAPQPKGNGS